MKINKIFVNDKLIDKRVEYFSEINEKIIQEKITPEFKFEIELVQFGKCNFSEEREANVFQKKGEIRTRYFDEDGNIFFLLNGIFQTFFIFIIKFLKLGEMDENGRVRNGEVESFNKNNKIWKGIVRFGKKWEGKGTFEWKDKHNKYWECNGKQK